MGFLVIWSSVEGVEEGFFRSMHCELLMCRECMDTHVYVLMAVRGLGVECMEEVLRREGEECDTLVSR